MCDMSISPFGMLSSYLVGGDSNMWETLEGATITQPQHPNGDATIMYWPLRQVGMSCNNLDVKGHVQGGHMGDAKNVSWSTSQKKRGARVATPSNAINVEEEEEEVVSKKRRLSAKQVRLLEAWFEKEKRVEPEKKQRLAKELGLHPRQVAVWFQNRRARGKAKQLESSLHLLTSDYQALLSERDALKDEVANLKSQLLLKKEEEVVMATSSSYYRQEDGFMGNTNFPHNSLPIMLDSPSNTSISSPTTQESFDGSCKVTCSNMLGNAGMLIHHQNHHHHHQQQQQHQDHIVDVVASLKYGDFLEDTFFMASSGFLPHDQYDDDNHDEIPWLWP